MNKQGKRIRVVEDNEENRDLLGRLLGTQGYEFDSAQDGIEAMEKLRAGAFDLIISDVLMPRMDGFQLCRAVKSDEELKAIPIIFYTGQYTNADDEKLAKSLCAALYLHKPMEKDKLLENIRQVLERSGAGEISAPARILDEKDFTAAHADRMAIKLTHKIEELERERSNLRESEERQRTILNTAMDGFWLTDTQGRILEVNETYCRMSGYSEEELLTMRIPDLEAVEAPADVADHIKNIVVQGEVRFETRHRRKDGTIFDAEISVQYRPVQGGRFVAFLRDVTERKQVEEALRESELRMRSIADSAQDAILMMDSAGMVSYWNPAAEHILGYTRAEAIGQNLHSFLVPPRYHAAHHAAFPLFLQTGHGAAVGKTLDLSARRKDGKEISVQLSLSAIQINSDWHAVGILRDVTDRKRMENELLKAKNELEQRVIERTKELAKVNEKLMTEILERKMLNTTLKTIAAYNRSLFESNIDPFVTINLEGKLTDLNSRHIYNDVRYNHAK